MKTRKKKLVRKDVQLGLIGSHVGLMVLALVFQFLAFLYAMMGRGSGGTEPESANVDILAGLTQSFVLTLVVVLPMTVMAGMLTTHRVAGPIARFKQFLEGVVGGEALPDLQLRRGDKLQDICHLLNEATRAKREKERPRTEVERAA